MAQWPVKSNRSCLSIDVRWFSLYRPGVHHVAGQLTEVGTMMKTTHFFLSPFVAIVKRCIPAAPSPSNSNRPVPEAIPLGCPKLVCANACAWMRDAKGIRRVFEDEWLCSRLCAGAARERVTGGVTSTEGASLTGNIGTWVYL